MCRTRQGAHDRRMLSDYRTVETLVEDRQRELRQAAPRSLASDARRRSGRHHRFPRLWRD
jgi:hypothetical protein